MARSKRGERERRAERVGECTGWAARLGKQLVGSALDTICDGEHWRCLVVAIRCGGHWRRLIVSRFRSALMLFFAWAVDAGGVTLVACVHPVVARALSCRLHVVVSFARCRVICAVSLSLLGGCGDCCHSWMAGIVSAGGLDVTLHWADVVVKRMWVVVGRCVEVVGGVVCVVVVVEEDTSQ